LTPLRPTHNAWCGPRGCLSAAAVVSIVKALSEHMRLFGYKE
jgi:NhaP-type Na+/H+ or K+/H+ antiporter